MSKNPYEILGVPANASRQEVDEAYFNLRSKYRLDMHSEGEKGKRAAEALNEVELAYRDILVNFSDSATFNHANSNTNAIYQDSSISSEPEIQDSVSAEPKAHENQMFASVDAFIREKNFGAAQKALDNISERNAEWHFYQSAIYYKQGWVSESKSQLELACNMDPSNAKYRNSLNKLNEKINSKNVSHQSYQNTGGGYQRSYSQSDYDARATEDTCCRTCQTLICINCLCDCCCRG